MNVLHIGSTIVNKKFLILRTLSKSMTSVSSGKQRRVLLTGNTSWDSQIKFIGLANLQLTKIRSHTTHQNYNKTALQPPQSALIRVSNIRRRKSDVIYGLTRSRERKPQRKR